MNINSSIFVPQAQQQKQKQKQEMQSKKAVEDVSTTLATNLSNLSDCKSSKSPISRSTPVIAPTPTVAPTMNLGQWHFHFSNTTTQLNFDNIQFNNHLQYYQRQYQQQQQQNHTQQQQQRNFLNQNYRLQQLNMMPPQKQRQRQHNQQQQQQQRSHHQQQQQQKHPQQKCKLTKSGNFSLMTSNSNDSGAPKKSLNNNQDLSNSNANLTNIVVTTTTTTNDTRDTTTKTTTTTSIDTEMYTKTNDTMQRNSSKACQNNKPHKGSPYRQNNINNQHGNESGQNKNDSSDSSQQQQHHHQQQQQQQNGKNRKGRMNGANKRHDNNGQHNNGPHGDGGQKQRRNVRNDRASAAATAAAVDEWWESGMVYCYDRRYMSSCAQDNMLPRHNSVHRNSTSSDATGSDDLQSSSSNEDLSGTYTVMPKINKKSPKSRQRRQQKRKAQQINNNKRDNGNPEINDEIPMDVDVDEMKENQLTAANTHKVNNNNNNKTAAQNMKKCVNFNARQSCAKSHGLKSLTKGCTNDGNNKKHSEASLPHHALSNSSSISSVCSSISSNSSSAFSTSASMQSLNSRNTSYSSSSTSSSPTSSPTASPAAHKRNAEQLKKIARALAPQPPLRQFAKLNMSEQELAQHLYRYVIDPNLLRVYGFPVESFEHDGCIEIYKCLPKSFSNTNHHHNHHHHNQMTSSCANVINTHDGLSTSFNASTIEAQDAHQLSADSGQGSGESSPQSLDSDSSEVGEDESNGATAFYTPDGSYQIFSQYDQSLEKQCVRCKRTFHVTQTGEYLSQEPCVFHWGKLNQMYTASSGFGYQYSCCQGDINSEGCTHNPLHVWTGAVVGLNGPYTDFVHTRPRYEDSERPVKIYALDCEMSFTGRGLEVTKITVISYDGQLVYEHFVRPEADIVDYNTRFSGITEKDLSENSNKSVKTLQEVQRDLLMLFDADTILIGHGLDNDLRVLRLVHKTIIDTSITFPHANGFPYRRALKHLTKICLNRDIQCGETGHSSYEDSRACLELMLWKVRKEMQQCQQQQQQH